MICERCNHLQNTIRCANPNRRPTNIVQQIKGGAKGRLTETLPRTLSALRIAPPPPLLPSLVFSSVNGMRRCAQRKASQVKRQTLRRPPIAREQQWCPEMQCDVPLTARSIATIACLRAAMSAAFEDHAAELAAGEAAEEESALPAPRGATLTEPQCSPARWMTALKSPSPPRSNGHALDRSTAADSSESLGGRNVRDYVAAYSYSLVLTLQTQR